MPICEGEVSCSDRSVIGAVVIGRNEGARLRQCLASLHGKVANVVYVDSASTDGSAELAREQGASVVELTAEAPLTAARGRRAGYEFLVQQMPDCRYIQFVDGDCVLQGDWLLVAAEFLDRHPPAAVVCGRRFEAHPTGSFYNQIIDQEWDTPVGQAEACGGDSLMRVTALQEAGSFRAELLAGEEPELCTRLVAKGWTIWRIDAPMTEHDAKIERISQWLKRARRGGAGYAQVWSVTRKLDRPLYGRQMGSALFWSVGVPVASVLLALATQRWAALALFPLLWIGQVVRIALRRNGSGAFSWRFRAAALTMLSKFAEAEGILRFMAGNKKQGTSYRSATPLAAATKGSA
jgi:GT2 family glycosyltransferase